MQTKYRQRIWWLGLVAAALFFSYGLYSLQPAGSRGAGGVREIYIDKGEGFSEVADILASEKFIRSARAFKWYALFSGSAHLVKPGYYALSPDDGAVSILEKIVQGPPEVVVKISEGATLADVDLQLFAAGITPSGAIRDFSVAKLTADYVFLKGAKSLEGFLFPDSYRFIRHAEPEAAVRKILDNFILKALPILGSERIDTANFYRDLILASLVEKEVPDVGNERPLVAGILRRRLQIGMGLQVDATVIYAKCRGVILSCVGPKLEREDFLIKSLYNTYLYRGLPPTPIGNPGESAIRAAVNSQASDYLYYLSDPNTGRTIFSHDFDEHDDQRAKYLGQ